MSNRDNAVCSSLYLIRFEINPDIWYEILNVKNWKKNVFLSFSHFPTKTRGYLNYVEHFVFLIFRNWVEYLKYFGSEN